MFKAAERTEEEREKVSVASWKDLTSVENEDSIRKIGFSPGSRCRSHPPFHIRTLKINARLLHRQDKGRIQMLCVQPSPCQRSQRRIGQ